MDIRLWITCDLLACSCKLDLHGVITVPDNWGSRLWGTRTWIGSTPKAEGLFSNMRTRSATEPPGLPPGYILRRGVLRSEMCCFCSGVSSGWGAEGISIRLLFRRRNCSNRKEEGSSPQGLSKMLLPMDPKLLGLTPPSRAGSDKAILCFASSNLRLISRNFASLTNPDSSKRLGMGECCPWSLVVFDTANGKAFLFAFCNTEGDLRPVSLELGGTLLMGICLTGIGILPSFSSLSVWMWRGEVLELVPLLKLLPKAALELLGENIDCIGLWISLILDDMFVTLLALGRVCE